MKTWPWSCHFVPSGLCHYQWCHKKQGWQVWQKYQRYHEPTFSALHWYGNGQTNMAVHWGAQIQSKKVWFLQYCVILIVSSILSVHRTTRSSLQMKVFGWKYLHFLHFQATFSVWFSFPFNIALVIITIPFVKSLFLGVLHHFSSVQDGGFIGVLHHLSAVQNGVF